MRSEEGDQPGNVRGSCLPSIECADRKSFFLQDIKQQSTEITYSRNNLKKYHYEREDKCNAKEHMYDLEPLDKYNYMFTSNEDLNNAYATLQLKRQALKDETRRINKLIEQKNY